MLPSAKPVLLLLYVVLFATTMAPITYAAPIGEESDEDNLFGGKL
jgi:hypothetical protein